MSSRLRSGPVLYWVLAVLLIGFGFLGIFSIGAPFLLTGLAMLVVGPWKGRARVLWPTLVGVWSFVLGYVLVAPLECTGTAKPLVPRTSMVHLEHTTCTNLLGIDYSGPGNYNPSLAPAFIAGLVAAAIGAVLTRQLILRRRATHAN